MHYIFEMMTLLGVGAIGGVIKLWRDMAQTQAHMRSVEARLRKIDELKLEGSLAEIKTELTHIRTILERGIKT